MFKSEKRRLYVTHIIAILVVTVIGVCSYLLSKSEKGKPMEKLFEDVIIAVGLDDPIYKK